MPIIGVIDSSKSGNLTPTSGFVSLATFTYTSTTSGTLTFNNIPSTYQHLEVRYSVAENVTNNNAFLATWLNGDQTTSNYATVRTRAFQYTVTGGGGASSQAYSLVTSVPYLITGETAQDNPDSDNKYMMGGMFRIPNYAGSRRKNMSNWFYQQTGSNDYVVGRNYGQWASTASITSISMTLTFAWQAGSTVSIYGVK